MSDLDPATIKAEFHRLATDYLREHANLYRQQHTGNLLALMAPQIDRLADALTEAQGRERRIDALFAGGPDTPCRTTWYQEGCPDVYPAIECVEVPMADLRAALSGPESGESR